MKAFRSFNKTQSFPIFRRQYSVPSTNVTVLQNGLTVATQHINVPTCTVGLFIQAGSRYEDEKTNGTSHFLEHMAFKGTEKLSQSKMELEIESRGSHLFAYCSREQTVFYGKGFKNDSNRLIEILSDIIQNPQLKNDAIERERMVILREMQEVDTQLDEVVFDYLHSTAYQGTPLGYTILGPTENIRNINRDNLIDFIRRHYTGPRVVLVAVGDVSHDEVIRTAEKNLSSLLKLSVHDEIKPSKYTGSEVRLRNDDMPFAHVAMAVEGCSWTSPDFIPLMMGNMLIGTWNQTLTSGKNMSSNLARKVANNRLASSFMSFNACYHDTGLWGVYFVSDRTHCEEMATSVQSEWKRLCTSITDGEVERAKNALKTNLRMQLDGTTQIFEDIGRQIQLFGEHIPYEKIEEKIDSIDAKKLKNVLSKKIHDQCLVVSCLGPVEALPDYTELRNGMSSIFY